MVYYQPGRYYKVKEEYQAPTGHMVGKNEFVYCTDYTSVSGESPHGAVTFSDMYGTYTLALDMAYKCIDSEGGEEPAQLPTEKQIGGNHYKNYAIQPFEFIQRNKLSFAQGNIIKYICRYKDKGGLEDLKKAKHYIDLIIQTEYGTNL